MNSPNEAKRVVVRGRVKIKRGTVTLDNIAAALATDFTAAIYSAVSNKTIAGQQEGDYLSDVVEQSLDRQGMSEELLRMGSTKIEVNVGLDISGSMFSRYGGRPIVAATVVMRVLNKAFDIVRQSLPAGVFKANLWLWAMSGNGRHCRCLTDQRYGTYQSKLFVGTEAEQVKMIDDLLAGFGKHEPYYAGGGTELAPLIQQVTAWENDEGDPTAHRLLIAITDGALEDASAAAEVQNWRSGKLYNLLYNVGGYSGDVPAGFLAYGGNVLELEGFVRQSLFDFVQTIY